MKSKRSVLLFLIVMSSSLVFMERSRAQSLPTRENPALLEVRIRPGLAGLADMEVLHELDLDIAYANASTGEVEIVADYVDMHVLDLRGISYRVVHFDLIRFYQSRFDPDVTLDLGYGTMGHHFTYSEVNTKLDEFRTKYPNLISQRISIGQSNEGRDLWAAKISDNPDQDENEPEAIIDCLTHAREPQGLYSTLYFMNWLLENYPADPMAKFLVEEREMWFLPVVNPDGYVHNQSTHPNGGGMWRKNRRKNGGWSYGVDQNRNWGYKWGYSNHGSSSDPNSEVYRGPAPMSEPEVQAVADFIIARNAVERMSIHCYGNYWLIPWCYDKFITNDDALFRELAKEMAPVEYEIGTCWELLYVANGVSLDWDYGDRDIMTFSPEMGKKGDGFWPPSHRIQPIAEENLDSLKYFYAISGTYLKKQGVSLADIVGDGNGYPDAGETIELAVTVKNLGLLDCAGPVTLHLSSTYPHANIVTGSAQVAAISKRSEGDNGAQPFVIDILPSAGYSDVIEFDLEILFDGASIMENIPLIIGTPRRMIFDDLENGQDWWAIGAPLDNATDGIWEHGDPNGTFVGNEPVQPEDDHTPSGMNCFVTKNSPPGAGPDDHDVDGGKTTLYTPVFDLTGGILPRLGYSRWYAHPGNYGAYDNLKTAVTNDGGATWINLESTVGQESNLWKEVIINVEDYVAASDRMQVRFVARDALEDSIVEAAIDDFWVEVYSTHPVLSLFGGLATGEMSTLGTSWKAGAQVGVYISLHSIPGMVLPGGTWYLDWPLFDLGITTLPGSGTEMRQIPVLNEPALKGMTLYFQALAVPAGGGMLMASNLVSGVVE